MASRRTGTSGHTPAPPPTLPPKTAEETAHSLEMAACFNALAAQARDDNLANAVLLAQQAACGYGPLVDHFAELGRRYGDLLNPAKASRTTLRVIEGGPS